MPEDKFETVSVHWTETRMRKVHQVIELPKSIADALGFEDSWKSRTKLAMILLDFLESRGGRGGDLFEKIQIKGYATFENVLEVFGSPDDPPEFGVDSVPSKSVYRYRYGERARMKDPE